MNEFEIAIEYLKKQGIEAFELMNILVIPVDSPKKIMPTVSKVKTYLKECGYQKSWRVDPYYYERQQSVKKDMFA